MITFPCKCGHIFNLTQDQAGGLTQCPRCGLLADVPTLADLPHLNLDGTFHLDDLPDRPAPAAGHLYHTFTRHTTDAAGREKDLRPDADLWSEVGKPSEQPTRIVPRYDPLTGELIRPLALKSDQPLPVLPLLPLHDDPNVPLEAIPVPSRGALQAAAPRTIHYSTNAGRTRITPATLALELLMPASAIVMFFVFLDYIAADYVAGFLAEGSRIARLPLIVLNLPLWFAAAHYGCVIEDTGPNAIDELPRPLRNFSFSDDLINPLVWVALAGLICYLPAALAISPRVPIPSQFRIVAVAALGIGGSLLLPAVLLTCVTGTTFLNLRPDRLLGVIFACGGEYLLSVGVFLLAIASGVVYWVPAVQVTLKQSSVAIFQHLSDPYLELPLLAVAVYLAHYFCWHLGLMYRAHHGEFPWLLQRHIPTHRAVRRR